MNEKAIDWNWSRSSGENFVDKAKLFRHGGADGVPMSLLATDAVMFYLICRLDSIGEAARGLDRHAKEDMRDHIEAIIAAADRRVVLERAYAGMRRIRSDEAKPTSSDSHLTLEEISRRRALAELRLTELKIANLEGEV